MKPKLHDSKLRIDQDNIKELEEPNEGTKSTNMDTIIKTIALKEFAMNKMIDISKNQKGINKPFVSVEPDSNFDEFRLIYNPHTYELLIIGGFI